MPFRRGSALPTRRSHTPVPTPLLRPYPLLSLCDGYSGSALSKDCCFAWTALLQDPALTVESVPDRSKRHRAWVQVVDDPHPGRLVDDQLMRRSEDIVPLGRDERLLRLRQQFVDLEIGKVTPVPVGWREAGGVVVSIER